MENQETPAKKKSPVKFIILAVILLVAGYYGFKKISFALAHETTDNAQVETQIAPVLPRVAGYVKEVRVKDNQVVKKGDTLSAIAKRNGTTVSAICKKNGIKTSSTLRLGQKIKL